MYYILYNPKSSKKNIEKKVDKFYKKLSKSEDCYKINLLDIRNKETLFVSQCKDTDCLVVCGGDGTLDQFVNRIRNEAISCPIYYYSCGTANDYARNNNKNFFEITKDISLLPKIKINSKEEYLFFNGVGMGIDSFMCRSKSQYKFSQVKKSYFSIGLSVLKTFRPFSLDVEFDEEKRHYDNVWLFDCNHGKYTGSGLIITPNAVKEDEYLDVCIIHGLSLRKMSFFYPMIFLGKYFFIKKNVDRIRCKRIKAVPNGCNVLQRDGEVLDYVKEIEVER